MSLHSLQKYAEWYYTKYFPSIRILREKIQSKALDEHMVDEVMEVLKPLFVEKNIIESRIHEYIQKGKTQYFIRQKLSQKKFDSVLVKQALWQMEDVLENPEMYRSVIRVRCKKAQNKGFSRKRILYELQWQYPHARSIIDEELDAYDDMEALSRVVLPLFLKKYSQEKTIQKCLQTGFSLRDIQMVLRKIDS